MIYSGALRRAQTGADTRSTPIDRSLVKFWRSAIQGEWHICQPLSGWSEYAVEDILGDRVAGPWPPLMDLPDPE